MNRLSLALVFGAALPLAAHAAIIDNGVVQLGVDSYGQLNVQGGPASPVSGTTAVGLRYLPSGFEAIAHGCLCEGWGVGIGETRVSGSANNQFGTAGLRLLSFVTTGSTALSETELEGTGLRITHAFAPSITPTLYGVQVSLTNHSDTDIADLRYSRAIDWDIEPTAFHEFVTVKGSGLAAVLSSSNDAFVSPDPFAARNVTPDVTPLTGDFTRAGPGDQGSVFDLALGPLAAGATRRIEFFLGAAPTEATALRALEDVQAELFALAQSADDPLGTGAGGAATFIFAARGLGGSPIAKAPSPVPLPAGGWLLMGALAGLAALRRRG